MGHYCGGEVELAGWIDLKAEEWEDIMNNLGWYVVMYP